MEWNSRSGMEKYPTSQAFKTTSGFLTSFGMTPEGIFPQPVKPAPTGKARSAESCQPEGRRYTIIPPILCSTYQGQFLICGVQWARRMNFLDVDCVT